MEYLEGRALRATVTWTGAAGDGLWFDAANWDAGKNSQGQIIHQVPGANDAATIGEDAGIITVNGNADVDSLSSGSGTTISITSNPSINIDSLTVAGGITNDGIISLDDGGELNASGTQAILGTGQVTFGTGYFEGEYGGIQYTTLAVSGGATLTIGSSITVSGALGFVGAGTGSIINQGVVSSTGSLTVDAASFDNKATVSAIDGGTLNLASPDTTLEGNLIQPTGGGTVSLSGTIINAGTLSVDTSGGSFVLGPGGIIEGGTIEAATPGSVLTTSSGGTLDGVTLDIDLDAVADEGSVNVVGGLTLDSTLTIDNGSSLNFSGSQTLGGDGNVVFGPHDYFVYPMTSPAYNQVNVEGTSTLTIGSGVGVTGQSGDLVSSSGSIVNQGTIASTGSISIETYFIEQGGSFLMSGGGGIHVDSTIENTGNTISLDTSDGAFYLNGGTILGGTITAAAPGSAITAAGGTLDGATLDINLDVTLANYFSGAGVRPRRPDPRRHRDPRLWRPAGLPGDPGTRRHRLDRLRTRRIHRPVRQQG